MSHFHLFNRGGVIPPALSGDAARDLDSMRDFITNMAQEVRQIHNSIQSFEVTVAALAASKAIVLPVPRPDAIYRMSIVADWATMHAVSSITTTGFTDTFSVAAPAITGGTLYVLVVG